MTIQSHESTLLDNDPMELDVSSQDDEDELEKYHDTFHTPPTGSTLSPSQQHELIHSILQEHEQISSMKEGDIYCVLNMEFYNHFLSYVNGKVPQKPPQIDNWPLVSNASQFSSANSSLFGKEKYPKLDKEKLEGSDYKLIPASAWVFLAEWYGGGPCIARRVILDASGMPRVELQPLFIRYCVLDPKETHQKFEELLISSTTTARKLKDLLSKKIEPPTFETRLWMCSFRSPKDLIDDENLDKPMSDIVSKQDGEEFCIEVRDRTGNWPTEDSKATQSISYQSTLQTLPSSSFSKTFSENMGDDTRSTPGLTGLDNLGNTCFMNSAIQCLSKTFQIQEYFNNNHYSSEINLDNPLGTKGKIAEAFASVMQLMWSGKHSRITPRKLKNVVSTIAPQFSGYQQHDSCEFLMYLLDGIHEDLNRIYNKPYTEAVEASLDGNLDATSKMAWNTYKLRNDSIITDKFSGQLKSTVECPHCSRVSITFDPFTHISLPIPKSTDKVVQVTFFSWENSQQPTVFAVKVDKEQGTIHDIQNTLAAYKNIDADCILILQKYSYSSTFCDPSKKVTYIGDKLVAYEFPRKIGEYEQNYKKEPLLTELTIKVEEKVDGYSYGGSTTMKDLGVQLFLPRSSTTTARELYDHCIEIVKRHLKSYEELLAMHVDLDIHSSFLPTDSTDDPDKFILFHLERSYREKLFYNDETLPNSKYSNTDITLCINRDAAQNAFNFSNFNDIEEHPSVKETQKSKLIDLDQCFKLFSEREQLGENDKWYCSTCKDHVRAFKTIELWNVPEILVIQLKRFLYTEYTRDKISSNVHFPIKDLDMSSYVVNNKCEHKLYDLYAVSHHFGSLLGGHYTAHARIGDQWYNFDDSRVSPARESDLQSKSAYVLFYTSKRVSPAMVGTKKDGKEMQEKLKSSAKL